MEILDLVVTYKWYDEIDLCNKREEYRECTPFYRQRLVDKDGGYRHFDAIRFHRGYSRKSMIFEHKGTRRGAGKEEWGAPYYEVYIIKLGNRLVE